MAISKHRSLYKSFVSIQW